MNFVKMVSNQNYTIIAFDGQRTHRNFTFNVMFVVKLFSVQEKLQFFSSRKNSIGIPVLWAPVTQQVRMLLQKQPR